MINIAICEDNFVDRGILNDYLIRIMNENSYNISLFKSGEELLDNYPDDLDILLLDILMKKINGIDTAKKIREFDSNVEIIFITSLLEYALQGYEVKAFRYILKPIEYEQLSINIIQCLDDINNKASKFVYIKCNSDIVKIDIESILYIEKISRYIFVYTEDQVYKSKMNLKDIEKKLQHYKFYRCHLGYLVNVNKIDCLGSSEVSIYNHSIPVSRGKRKILKEFIIDSKEKSS
ncbi:TPA: LytR/AlgR family response regulator transcription factor [Clostridioides difficile]